MTMFVIKSHVDIIRETLNAKGWYVAPSHTSTEADLRDQIRAQADNLGAIVPGRNRQLIERIVPQTTDAAPAGSLSSKYGLDSLPLHTDTAHWPIPCRYLVMACVDPGPVPTATTLFDSRSALLSQRDLQTCQQATFLIRNGRRSFYGSILERNRPFIRIDPGCMVSLYPDGEIALQAFSADNHKESLHRHDWKVGEIMIIDNWRVLHGRGNGQRTHSARTLLRAMIQ
jgi:alpha-ketoglutarate-dependent taurine dioxygenase